MPPVKLLSVGLIAAAMLAAPAMARESHAATHHISERAHASASLTGHYTDPHPRVPESHARAVAPESGNEPGGICDFGDNPMIC
jgi:hypothetical protein